MQTVATITQFLDEFAPRRLAADWDNVGLLLGDSDADVERVMTCLTITPEVVAEAVKSAVHLIVTHHPMLFRAAKQITTNTVEGRMIWELCRAGVAVYSPHTSFDNTKDGINDLLAKKLGLTDTRPLRMESAPASCKIVVFVPEDELSAVSDAMFKAGAGRIGEYSECSFRLKGTGTFHGSDDSNPTVGSKGRREDVSELRLEVICPERNVGRVIAAMVEAHSYEEPAYDVYPLRAERSLGLGHLGVLPAATALSDLAQVVKKELKASVVQMVGEPDRKVGKVAIACGAAGDFLNDAAAQTADVFLTGEMRFHDYLAANAKGVALLLPGHYATERCGIEDLADRILTQWPDLDVWASRSERDPVSVF